MWAFLKSKQAGITTILALLMAGLGFAFADFVLWISSIKGLFWSLGEILVIVCAIALVALAAPQMSEWDLNLRKARRNALAYIGVLYFFALAIGALMVFVSHKREFSRAQQDAAALHIPFDPEAFISFEAESTISNIALIMAIAMILVTFFGRLIGAVASTALYALGVGISLLLPPGTPFPIGRAAQEGTWFEPVAVSSAVVLAIIAFWVYYRFYGRMKTWGSLVD